MPWFHTKTRLRVDAGFANAVSRWRTSIQERDALDSSFCKRTIACRGGSCSGKSTVPGYTILTFQPSYHVAPHKTTVVCKRSWGGAGTWYADSVANVLFYMLDSTDKACESVPCTCNDASAKQMRSLG